MARSNTPRSAAVNESRSALISPRAAWAEKVGSVAIPIPEPITTSGMVMIGKAQLMAEREPVDNPQAMIEVTTAFTCMVATLIKRGPISRITSLTEGLSKPSVRV